MHRFSSLAALVVATLAVTSTAHATNYDDVATDFSNAYDNPTVLTLTTGSNLITGRTGAMGTVDRDYFRVNVPNGFRLSAINLISTDTPSASFFGVNAGTVSVNPDTVTAGQMLGYVLFRKSDEGTNLLVSMAAGSGAQGFVPPLGPGNYTFWMQETGTPIVNYQIDLVLTAAPAAAAAPAVPALFSAALALGLLGIGLRRRGQRS
jgi:hypothetical protein